MTPDRWELVLRGALKGSSLVERDEIKSVRIPDPRPEQATLQRIQKKIIHGPDFYLDIPLPKPYLGGEEDAQ